MARDKKPQKANKKKYADPKTGAFRHSDGDRRHRDFGAAAKDAVKLKRLMQELGGLSPEEPPSEEPADSANG